LAREHKLILKLVTAIFQQHENDPADKASHTELSCARGKQAHSASGL